MTVSVSEAKSDQSTSAPSEEGIVKLWLTKGD